MSDQYPPPPSGDPNQPPPGAPYSPGAPYAGGPVPPAPEKKRSVGKIIAIVLGVLLLVCVLCTVGTFLFARDTWNDLVNSSAANAEVGDCLAGDNIDSVGQAQNVDVKKVECSDSEAKYKVVGKFTDKTQADAGAQGEICEPFVKDGAQRFVWLAPSGDSKGTVLCLANAG